MEPKVVGEVGPEVVGKAASEPAAERGPRRLAERGAYAYAFIVITLALVLSPLAREPLDDSYPLSTFPMFSRKPEPILPLTQALGMHADGAITPLSPQLAAGTVEVLQAMVYLRREVDAGRARPLCEAIAARAAGEGAELRAVAIARSEFQLDSYFSGAPEPSKRRVVASCQVPR